MTLGDVLILGLGVSGQATARYCAGLIGTEANSVTVVDSRTSAELEARAGELDELGVRSRLAATSVEGVFDTCIASPGIPPHASLMISARESSAEILSEVEFAFRRSSHVWVAVTGTNGKTTTTALITHLLISAGHTARSVGNFGPPAIEAVADAAPGEILVAEVSSFQLALTSTFHPRVAVLLNVTPDHVDWHGSLEQYAADKGRVLANLGPDDTAVIDVDDPGAARFADDPALSSVCVAKVSRDRGFVDGATVVDGVLSLVTRRGVEPLISQDQLRILGPHNVSNALAASAAAHSLGVSPALLGPGLASFDPIEHRLEPMGSIGGIEWFNDSKATNPDAVSKAVDALAGRRLVWLLGGRNKANDFTALARQMDSVVDEVVVFGEAAEEIAAAFEPGPHHPHRAVGLAQAVRLAAGLADGRDAAVVLSPGCASFDEFDNFEQRGRVFRQLVWDLAEETAS